MITPRRLILAGVVLILAGIGWLCWWWGAGGQHWIAIQTGTYCGSTGVRYCYWSGFGSVFPWSLLGLGGIFTALGMHWRHIRCHEPGCPRIGRHLSAGGAYKYCTRHFPGHPDGQMPSREHRVRLHWQHHAATHAATHAGTGKEAPPWQAPQ